MIDTRDYTFIENSVENVGLVNEVGRLRNNNYLLIVLLVALSGWCVYKVFDDLENNK
jgi:hypothetical protein